MGFWSSSGPCIIVYIYLDIFGIKQDSEYVVEICLACQNTKF